MGNLPQNQSYGNQGGPFAVGSTFKVPKIQLPSAPSGATLGSRLGVSPNTPALPWRSLDPTLASKENALQTYTYNAGVPTEQPAFPSVDQNGNPIGTNTPIPIPSDYSGFVPAGGYNNPQDGTSGSWANPVSPVIKNFPGDVQGQYVQDTANPNALIKSQRGTNLSENKFILNGRPSALNQIDHIMPLELGGADTMANREILTFEQNQQKTVAQAVPYTLYAHGQISLTEARLMATQWKDRDIGGLNHPDNVGLIPLKQAEDAAYRWTQPAQVTFKDIMAGIPQAAKDLGKGFLPDPVREFIKGFGSTGTYGFLPYEQGENEDALSKYAGYGGMLAGGIASFSWTASLLKGAFGVGATGVRVLGALKGTAETAAATEGLVSGEAAITEAAPGLGTRVWNAVRGVKTAVEPVVSVAPDTAPNYLYHGLVSPLTKPTIQGALTFGATNVVNDQIQQYVQNHYNPDILSGKRQATTEQNTISRIFSDLVIGTVAGVASPTLRGAGLAMAPVLALSFVEDPHHPMNALTNAVIFGAFHIAGSGAKKMDIENLKQSFADTQQNPDFQAFKSNVLDRPHYNTLNYYAPELYPDLKPGDPIPSTAYEPATVKIAASKAKAALDIRKTFDINPDGTDAGVGMSDQAYNQELARIITASDQMSVGGLSPELQEQANIKNVISFAKSLKSKGKGPNGENLGSRFDQLQDIWTPRVTQNIAKYVAENKATLAPTESPTVGAVDGSKFLTGDMAGTGLGIKRNTEIGAQFFRQEPGWDTLPVVTAHLRPELEGVFRLGNDVVAKNPTLAKGRTPDPNPQNAIQLFGYKQNQSTGQLKSYALSYVAGDGRLNTDPLAINKETKTWTNPPPDIAINKDQLATAMDDNGVHILQLNVDWGRSTDSTVKSKNPFGVYTVSDKNWQDSIAMRDKFAADNVPNPYSQNIAQIRNSQNAKTVSAAIKNVSDKVVTDIADPASPQELKANLSRPTIDLVQTPEETAATFKMKDDPTVKQGLQTIAMAENSGSGKAVMKAKVQFTKILKEKMAESPDTTNQGSQGTSAQIYGELNNPVAKRLVASGNQARLDKIYRDDTGFLNKDYYADSNLANHPQLVVKIGGLKEINNQGHAAGDAAIKETGEAIQAAFPDSLVVHKGGKTFSVITEGIPETPLRESTNQLSALNQKGYGITSRWGDTYEAADNLFVKDPDGRTIATNDTAIDGYRPERRNVARTADPKLASEHTVSDFTDIPGAKDVLSDNIPEGDKLHELRMLYTDRASGMYNKRAYTERGLEVKPQWAIDMDGVSKYQQAHGEVKTTELVNTLLRELGNRFKNEVYRLGSGDEIAVRSDAVVTKQGVNEAAQNFKDTAKTLKSKFGNEADFSVAWGKTGKEADALVSERKNQGIRGVDKTLTPEYTSQYGQPSETSGIPPPGGQTNSLRNIGNDGQGVHELPQVGAVTPNVEGGQANGGGVQDASLGDQNSGGVAVAPLANSIVAKARELLPSVKSLESQAPAGPTANEVQILPAKPDPTMEATKGIAEESARQNKPVDEGQPHYASFGQMTPEELAQSEFTRLTRHGVPETRLGKRELLQQIITKVNKAFPRLESEQAYALTGKALPELSGMDADYTRPSLARPGSKAGEYGNFIKNGIKADPLVKPQAHYIAKAFDKGLQDMLGKNYQKIPRLTEVLDDYFKETTSREVNSEGKEITNPEDVLNYKATGEHDKELAAYQTRNIQNLESKYGISRSDATTLLGKYKSINKIPNRLLPEPIRGQNGISPEELSGLGLEPGEEGNGGFSGMNVHSQSQDENIVHNLTEFENSVGGLFAPNAKQTGATAVEAIKDLFVGGKDAGGLRRYILSRIPSAKRSVSFDDLIAEAKKNDAKIEVKSPSTKAETEVPSLEKKAAAITRALEHGPDQSLEQALEDVKAKIQKYSALIEESKKDGGGGPGFFPGQPTEDSNGASGQWGNLRGQLGRMAQTTQDVPTSAFEPKQPQLDEDKATVLNKVPFTLSAHDTLLRGNVGAIDPSNLSGGDGKPGTVPDGVFTPKGQDFRDFVQKHVSPMSQKAADYIVDNTNLLQTLNKEHINVSNTDPETLTHEMMHQLFEQSPMGTKLSDLSKNEEAENFGYKFLDAWDKVTKTDPDMGPKLQQIDDHINTNYDTTNMGDADVATERFAYLGELVIRYGIGIIPKELRPYYSSVFDFKKGSAK